MSRAPLAKLQAYKQRMGWTFPWASSFGSDFNYDFHVSHTQRDRTCPDHAVQALNRLAGARVIWDDTRGINEYEATALRLAEERSQLARTDTAI